MQFLFCCLVVFKIRSLHFGLVLSSPLHSWILFIFICYLSIFSVQEYIVACLVNSISVQASLSRAMDILQILKTIHVGVSTWPQSPSFPQKLATALKNKTSTLHSSIHVYHRCLTINSLCTLTLIVRTSLNIHPVKSHSLFTPWCKLGLKPRLLSNI